jgi:hypothetical protein
MDFCEQNVDPIEYVQTLKPDVFGCTHAWSRNLFRLFGNLLPEVIHEDNALVFRSILAGKLVYVNERLVKYRVHEDNVFLKRYHKKLDTRSIEQEERRTLQRFKNREVMYASFILDLEHHVLQGRIARDHAEGIAKEARRVQRLFRIRREFMESSFWGKCKSLYRLYRGGVPAKDFYFFLPRLASHDSFVNFKKIRNNILSIAQPWGRI